MSRYRPILTEYLRHDNDILSGPSIRGSIALFKCARVQALLDGRDFVIPDDIKDLVMATTEHRIRVKPEAEMDEVTPAMVLERALEAIPVPKISL
jgi:MoxR-like ATPase